MAVAPTYARRELGGELKRLREAAKLTQARAADACSWSLTKIVRLEGGTVTLTLHDLHVLADLYEVGDEERFSLVEFMERAEEGQWWQAYGRLVTVAMDEYLSLEAQATAISLTNMTMFPGLLQCRSYTEALFAASTQVPDPDDADALVELRWKRQRILRAGTHVHATVSEAMLITPMGGRGVLKQQLKHLITTLELPNVEVQIVPLTTEQPMPIGGLIIYDFDDNATPVAYTEHGGGMTAYHRPHEVRRHRREADRVKKMALSPQKSIDVIQTRLRDL